MRISGLSKVENIENNIYKINLIKKKEQEQTKKKVFSQSLKFT